MEEYIKGFKDFINDLHHTYQGIKFANEINKLENNKLNMAQKFGLALLGSYVTEKNSK